MRLVTRCPACRALFEVRERQLQACEGWLRCGQCFNAFDSTGLVLPWSPVPVPDAAPAGSAQAAPPQRIDIRSLLRQHDASSPPSELPVDSLFQRLVPPSLDLDGLSEPARSAPAVPADAPADLKPLPLAAKDRSPEVPAHAGKRPVMPDRSASVSDGGAGSSETACVTTLEPATVRKTWPWGLACLAALVLLIGQGLHAAHGSLQLAVPAIQGWGQRFCARLGCDWPAVRVPVAVQLDSARLLREEERLVLGLRLRNTAAVDVALGALELSLLGPDAAVLVRRVLGPDAIGAPAVLSAGAVWEGQLQLQMDGLEQVQGYRALVFLP